MADLLPDQLRLMAEHHADEIGFTNVATDESLTFGEWDRRSNRLARWLVARGVAKGDRVAILIPPEEPDRFLIAYAAVHKAGAAAVPTSTRLVARELAFVLAHEYAHIILGHTPPPPGRRETPLAAAVSPKASAWSQAEELAADRLGLGLVHNAGFRVGAAPALIVRLGRERQRSSAWPGGSRWMDRRRAELERAATRLERGASSQGGPR